MIEVQHFHLCTRDQTMTQTKINRREFLICSAGLTLIGTGCSHEARSTSDVLVPDGDIPKRLLGKTGVRVSALSFGCGSVFLKGYQSDEMALEVLERAFRAGVNYFDTAHNYGEGESERRLGLFIRQQRRNDILVSTKIATRDGDEFMRQFEISLRRLQTDYVDVLHIHGIDSSDELPLIARKRGVYDRLVSSQNQKMVRFISFSCHADGEIARRAIEDFDFNCCMIQLNAAGIGKFEKLAVPAALGKNMGILAMKSTAQGQLLANANKGQVPKLLNYVWGLPVTSIVLGIQTPEMLAQNIAFSKKIKRLDESESVMLQNELAANKAYLEQYFRDHADC
jgi:uncharacterized protein